MILAALDDARNGDAPERYFASDPCEQRFDRPERRREDPDEATVPPAAEQREPAVSWMIPTMIPIQPEVWRLENAYCVPSKKCALLTAAIP